MKRALNLLAVGVVRSCLDQWGEDWGKMDEALLSLIKSIHVKADGFVQEKLRGSVYCNWKIICCQS